MYTEIIKIIEGGLSGDKEKVSNYSKLLAENLKKEGNLQLSNRITKAINNKHTSFATLDSFSSKPVDQESRMDIINVEFPSDSAEELVFNYYIKKEVEDFVRGYEKKDEIIKAGLPTNNSILLYGPPGCGKTSMAYYISYKTGLPLVTARFDGLVSSLLGSTSKNIRRIFDFAANRRCILFLDEFDVIAKLRDDNNELGELKRVVNSLIQNIDSFNSDSILIAATNHHELLDPAIWRRFNKIITLQKPSKEEIDQLIDIHIRKVNTNFSEASKKRELIVDGFEGMSHSDIKTVFENSIRKLIINGEFKLYNWSILHELYLFKKHTLEDENEYIKFMRNYGVTQTELSENFNISLRKIRDIQ